MAAPEDKDDPPVFAIEALGETVQHVDGVRFLCHVCGLKVWCGKEESGRASIIHKQPMCDRFRDMDPLDFLTEARKHYENHR